MAGASLWHAISKGSTSRAVYTGVLFGPMPIAGALMLLFAKSLLLEEEGWRAKVVLVIMWAYLLSASVAAIVMGFM